MTDYEYVVKLLPLVGTSPTKPTCPFCTCSECPLGNGRHKGPCLPGGEPEREVLRKIIVEHDEVAPKTKYKVGDKVLVRSDLKEHAVYGVNSYVPAMQDLLGKVVTIYEIVAGEQYKLVEEKGAYCWTDEMFFGLAPDGYSSGVCGGRECMPC